jgi:hypothetical protein
MQTFYSITLNSYIPLDLTRNKYYRFLRPGMSFRYLNRYYYSDRGSELGYNLFGISLYGNNLLKQSHRDIQPRFGQTFYFSYYLPIKKSEIFSNILTMSFNQYLPGFSKNHGILINIGYEKTRERKVPVLNNQISLPRGYREELYYYENKKVIFEYTMPLVYPDISIGPLIYIKRIQAAVFLDAARIAYPTQSGNNYMTVTGDFLSTGVILSSEMHFLRFFAPFTPGLRIAYLPIQRKADLNFNVSVNISAI